MADSLVCGDALAVYGDRAYESKKRRAWLKSQGIDLHRSHKNQSGLPEWQQEQRGDRAGAGVSGEGVWHAEAELRLPAGRRTGVRLKRADRLKSGDCIRYVADGLPEQQERSRDVVEADGLQRLRNLRGTTGCTTAPATAFTVNGG